MLLHPDLFRECLSFLDPLPHLMRLRVINRQTNADILEILSHLEHLDFTGVDWFHTFEHSITNRPFEKLLYFVGKYCTDRSNAAAEAVFRGEMVTQEKIDASAASSKKSKQPKLEAKDLYHVITAEEAMLKERGGKAIPVALVKKVREKCATVRFHNTNLKKISFPQLNPVGFDDNLKRMFEQVVLQCINLQELFIIGYPAFVRFGTIFEPFGQSVLSKTVTKVTILWSAVENKAVRVAFPNARILWIEPHAADDLQSTICNDDLSLENVTKDKHDQPLWTRAQFASAMDQYFATHPKQRSLRYLYGTGRHGLFLDGGQALASLCVPEETERAGQIHFLNRTLGLPLDISFSMNHERVYYGSSKHMRYTLVERALTCCSAPSEFVFLGSEKHQIVLDNIAHVMPDDFSKCFKGQFWVGIMLDYRGFVIDQLLEVCEKQGKPVSLLSPYTLERVLYVLKNEKPYKTRKLSANAGRIIDCLKKLDKHGHVWTSDHLHAAQSVDEIFQYLVTKVKTDAVDSQDSKKQVHYMLHTAAASGSFGTIVHVLQQMKLEAGDGDGDSDEHAERTNIMYRDQEGFTPLHRALLRHSEFSYELQYDPKKMDLVRALYQHSTHFDDANTSMPPGREAFERGGKACELTQCSLLQCFILNDFIDLAYDLLQNHGNEIDVNWKDKHGNTVLHTCVSRGTRALSLAHKLVLDHKIDISIKNDQGKTAYDILKNHVATSDLGALLSPLPEWLRPADAQEEELEEEPAAPASKKKQKKPAKGRGKKRARDEEDSDEEDAEDLDDDADIMEDDEEEEEERPKPKRGRKPAAKKSKR